MILGESAFTIATGGSNFSIIHYTNNKPDFDPPHIFISANKVRHLESGNEQEINKITADHI